MIRRHKVDMTKLITMHPEVLRSQVHNWAGSLSNYNQQKSVMWQPETVAKSDSTSQYNINRNQQMETQNGHDFITVADKETLIVRGQVHILEMQVKLRMTSLRVVSASQGFVPSSQQFNQSK
ncbi:Protein transport protein sec16 [Abeliophyllum distichum]|uniref:Protein transport protein sec16 n=1 Tax=Abeliophyllum distichum TaxID=126358 RepID=A0ABD1THD3_9LAMI